SMAVSRACFCQNLSTALFPKLDGAFLVGLFSYLPSFLDEELPTLLKDLPLDENIKSALLEYKGNLGGILKIVVAYEAGRWEKIPFGLLASKDMSKQSLKDLYIKSLKEAREMGSL
ncbi:MAG: histidine kinase, partial [Gammaproteobacteria bacterium]|nr:histidine kinase [Gammaproteobacteria bacterium]